ncbi:hypothetical protein DVH24_008557 [Malus domestica]|uniref:Sulfotransferase n=1 Tax=Malus domestica TaxID=3750 RepID=A0A498JMG3_MALDO|nr:hypothetical protein DVH24_008557 [Malus domestica]
MYDSYRLQYITVLCKVSKPRNPALSPKCLPLRRPDLLFVKPIILWRRKKGSLPENPQLQQHFNLFQTTGSSTSAARGSSPIFFLATFSKSGTTWLRALMFAVLNKSLYDVASPHHPLLTTGPHDCFPLLVLDNMLGNHDHNRPVTSLDHDHDDRDGGDVPPTSTTQLFATHLPYSLLPKSVTTSSSTCGVSKFVYVCRNPKDVFISLWIFASKVKAVAFFKITSIPNGA